MSNRISQAGSERIGHWLKALVGDSRSRKWCEAKNIALQKAAAEFPDQAGGWLVPSDFDASILALTEQYGAFRANCDIRTITADVLHRPRRVGGVSANWIGEGQSITESQMSLDNVETGVRKLAAMVRCSSEAFQDAESDVGRWFSDEVALAFATTEDDVGFNGDGSARYAGQRGLTAQLTGTAGSVDAQAGHDTFYELDSQDLASVMTAVSSGALREAAWFCHPNFYAQAICRLSVSTGGLVMTPSGPSYLGFPVYMSGSINDTAGNGAVLCFFGSLRRAAMLVQRRATIVGISTQRLLEGDQYLLRATQRIGINVHDVVGNVAMLLGKS